MKRLAGTAVSSGIFIGKAHLFLGDEFPEIPRWSINQDQIEKEWSRFTKARQNLIDEHKALASDGGQEKTAILKAHLLMLEDEDFAEQLRDRLESELQNVEWLVWSLSHEMVQTLLGSPDAYLRERAVDIADIAGQLVNELLDVRQISLADITEDVVVVSRDLMPSQALSMNKIHVKAIVLDTGSNTSHTAILARSFEIPAVLGTSVGTKNINSGDTLVVDGNRGIVYVNPNKAVLDEYKSMLVRFEQNYLENFSLRDVPAKTKDGTRFSVMANIELATEANKAFKYGAEGIGLFRSEFLFLTAGDAVEEEKQYRAYLDAVEAAEGKVVKIRTSDVGGDKVLPNFFSHDEKNPLLGWRAIRFSLAVREPFKVQLRAILRAAAHGPVEIIFPLVSSIEEYEQALSVLDEVKEDCVKNKIPIGNNVRTGVMIEVPAAALCADVFAKKADFFSIGTNDLIQYTLAVDRGNEKVNHLAQSVNPGVLRLIKGTIDAAHKEGKKAAMCGVMAGMPRYTPLLAGLGLDEFSMSSPAIPEVKRALAAVTLSSCKKLASDVMKARCTDEINALLDTFGAPQ